MSTAVAERPGVVPNPAIVTVTNPATPPASTLASEFATINDYATGSQRVSNDFKAKWQSTYKAAFQVVVSGGLNGSYTAKQYADFANAYEQAKLAGLVGVGTGRGGTSNFDSMYATALTKTAGPGAGLPPTGGLPGGGLPGGGVPGAGVQGPGNGGSSGGGSGGSGGGLDTVLQQMLSSDIKNLDAQIAASKQLTADFKAKWQSTYKPALEIYATGNGRSYTATQYTAFVDAYQKLIANPVISAGQWNALRSAYDQLTQSGPGRGIGSVPGSGAGGAIGGGGGSALPGGPVSGLPDRPGVPAQPNPAPSPGPGSTDLMKEFTALDKASVTMPIAFKSMWDATYRAAFLTMANKGFSGSYTQQELIDFVTAYKRADAAGLMSAAAAVWSSSANYKDIYNRAVSVLPAPSAPGVDVPTVPAETTVYLAEIQNIEAALKKSGGVGYSQWVNTYKSAFTDMANRFGKTLGSATTGRDILQSSVLDPTPLSRYLNAYLDLTRSSSSSALSGVSYPNLQRMFDNTVQRLYYNNTKSVFSNLENNVTKFNSISDITGLTSRKGAPDTTSITDVNKYLTQLSAPLKNQDDSIKSFRIKVDAVKNAVDTLLQKPVSDDARLYGVTVDPRMIAFVLNGSPDASQGQGALTYKTGQNYTFSGLLLEAFSDMMTNETDFLRKSKDGIAKVVQNRKAAEFSAVLNAVIESFVAIVSMGASLLKTSLAFTEMAAKLTDITKVKKFSAEVAGFSAGITNYSSKWASMSGSLSKLNNNAKVKTAYDMVNSTNMEGMLDGLGDGVYSDATIDWVKSKGNVLNLASDYRQAFKDLMQSIAENADTSKKSISTYAPYWEVGNIGGFIFEQYTDKSDRSGGYGNGRPILNIIENPYVTQGAIPVTLSYDYQRARGTPAGEVKFSFNLENAADFEEGVTKYYPIDLKDSDYAVNFIKATYGYDQQFRFGGNWRGRTVELSLVGGDLGGG